MRGSRRRPTRPRSKAAKTSGKAEDQRKARPSSIGGAANAAGETFRTDVAARIAVHILAQHPLPDLGPGHVPTELRLESGAEVDDIEVTMESGGTARIQAKRSLELSAHRHRPLASAFDQLVRQLVRTPSLDPSRDRLVLAYESGSARISLLRTAIRQFRSASPSEAQAAQDGQSQEALEVLREIIVAAWQKETGGSSPSWSEISAFLRFVVLWEVKEGDTSRVEVDPNHLLSTVVEDGSSTAAAAEILRGVVSTLAKDRRAADQSGLRKALLDGGIPLRDAAGFAQRVEHHLRMLERRWADHRPLGVLSENTVWRSSLKSSEVFVPPRLQPRGSQDESGLRAEDVLVWLRQGRAVALLGHIGTGKSTLLLWCAARLAARRREAPGEPVPILLHARELQERSWPEVLERALPGARRSGRR